MTRAARCCLDIHPKKAKMSAFWGCIWKQLHSSSRTMLLVSVESEACTECLIISW